MDPSYQRLNEAEEEEVHDTIVSIENEEEVALVEATPDRQIEFEADFDENGDEDELVDGPLAEPVLPLDTASTVKKSPSTAISLGGENDGVFANMSAKPDANNKDDGSSPQLNDELPTYADVQNDASVPTYNDAVVIPSILGIDTGDLVDGLPVGTVMSFLVTLVVSFTFQVVGFLIAFFLSTSHAGRHGAKAGLGVTLIQYGLFLKSKDGPGGGRHGMSDEWFFYVSLFCILLGWLTVIRSVGDFVKIRQLQAAMSTTS